ncbi:MAG: divalent-cation tolerance protein CutA [Actinomycetota bacterium]
MHSTNDSACDDECAIVEICSTFGSRERADDCAARLVRQRLAACVQVDGPLRSTYRWQGAVETAEEWRCICKTTPGRTTDCLEAIKVGHEYEVPQAVVTRCLGTPDYAAWVRNAVTE